MEVDDLLNVKIETLEARNKIVQCPSCSAEISEGDRFCQDCGESLPKLSSPLLSRQTPKTARSMVGLPILIGGLTITLISTAFVFFADKFYQEMSVSFPLERAKEDLKHNQFDEAIDILERMDLARRLTPDQRHLLDDVRLAKAEMLISQKAYPVALIQLNKISSSYPKMALVKQKIAEISNLSKSQSQASINRPTAHTALNKKVKVVAAKSADEPTFKTVQRLLNASVQPVSGANSNSKSSSVTETQKKQESEIVSGKPHKLESTDRSSPLTTRTDSPDLSTAGPSRADSVRYNELLMGYFSRSRTENIKPAEPPSLKEWIDLGKPSF